MNSEVAAALIDIEAQLRQLGHWDKEPPSAEAFTSDQPFSVDTLTFPQWLQFVFLPTLYQLLQEGKGLPGQCGIAPMAQEYFRGSDAAGSELITALKRIDELLSQGANSVDKSIKLGN